MRFTIGKLLGLDPARLRLVYMDGSGSYGTNGNDDVAFEAALLSQELKRPVRVQWMREDEHGWDPKGPPQLLDLRATLSADGSIAAWETVAMPPANTPNAGIPLLAAVAAGLDDGLGSQSGFTAQNSDPPYAIPNIHAEVGGSRRRRCASRISAPQARSGISWRWRAFSTSSPRRPAPILSNIDFGS